MLHLVAHARPGSLLFHTHDEARRAWRTLVAAFPGMEAACLMPDHVHMLVAGADRDRFARWTSGYARWRNHARGDRGAVWAPQPDPEGIPDQKHLRRTVRYVHLNPCRSGLASDPLEWPYSTHRDRVGLAVPAAVERAREPERFHAYVSGDPSVAVGGTDLPAGRVLDPNWNDVLDAVASVCRRSRAGVATDRIARALAVQVAWRCELRDAELLGGQLDLAHSSVWRIAATRPAPGVAICLRVLRDPRFGVLAEGDLHRQPEFRRYRDRS